MKTLNLKIDTTGIELKEEDKNITPIELTTRVVINTMINYAQNFRGLSKHERKTYFDIVEILEKCKNENIEATSLEDELMSFIRKCFRECRLMPSEAIKRVEENIDKAQ